METTSSGKLFHTLIIRTVKKCFVTALLRTINSCIWHKQFSTNDRAFYDHEQQ